MSAKAQAIVDAFLEKSEKVNPDGSTCEDIERDLLEPIADIERQAEFYEHWLNCCAQAVFGDERPVNWEIKLVDAIREMSRTWPISWSQLVENGRE
jgi:hypothetical protein